MVDITHLIIAQNMMKKTPSLVTNPVTRRIIDTDVNGRVSAKSVDDAINSIHKIITCENVDEPFIVNAYIMLALARDYPMLSDTLIPHFMSDTPMRSVQKVILTVTQWLGIGQDFKEGLSLHDIQKTLNHHTEEEGGFEDAWNKASVLTHLSYYVRTVASTATEESLSVDDVLVLNQIVGGIDSLSTNDKIRFMTFLSIPEVRSFIRLSQEIDSFASDALRKLVPVLRKMVGELTGVIPVPPSMSMLDELEL